MVNWEDHSDESREMILRFVRAGDVSAAAKRNHWVTIAVVFALLTYFAQAVAVLMYCWSAFQNS